MKRERDGGYGEGEGMQHSSRHSRLDQETLRYYSEIDAHFSSLDDDEEKTLMADNVLTETEGREPEIVPDAACSRVLERLIPHASPAVFAKFLEGCVNGENMGLICTRYVAGLPLDLLLRPRRPGRALTLLTSLLLQRSFRFPCAGESPHPPCQTHRNR